VPESVIFAGELLALLATVTLPLTLPVAAGANVTFSVTTCPGVMIWPLLTPVGVNPAPEIETLETVTLELPELVKFTLKMLLLPTFTLPKVRVDVLATSGPGTELTVSVATLLVMLPTELLTMTVNCAPLSAVVSAGVV
jgi:hypothetical protein